MIVVDTNVLAALYLPGPHSSAIERPSSGPCEYDVESAQVLELVCQTECSAYDCEFAALAITLGCSLVTMDRQLLRSFPGVAMRPAGPR